MLQTLEKRAPSARATPVRCGSCAVRAHSICGLLDADAMFDLGRLGRKIVLRPGQALLWEGNESALVGNVLEGALKLSTVTGDGREQIVGVVFPSDFIGRPFGPNSHHTVTALTPASVCVFSRHAFDSFAEDHAAVERALLRRTLDELDRARRWMLRLGRLTAAERVASLLVEIVERLDDGSGDPILLPFTRQQMADLLGLAIETVSRTLSKFEAAGLIARPGRRLLGVTDLDRLMTIATS